MKRYEISYSTIAGGSLEIEADCEDDAINQFDALEFEELFRYKDLCKGVEIDEIKEI